MVMPLANEQKTFGFGLRALKKYPELIPIVGVLGFAAVATVAFAGYSLSKNDIIINRRKELPPWERMDLMNPKPGKLLTVNQKLEGDQELIKLKEEMKK